MWSTEHALPTTATPAEVFAVWRDVAAWPRWDASLLSATLDGPFAAGAAGTLHPEGVPAPLPFRITAVDDDRGFADETALGPLVLRFVHRADHDGEGSLVTVRVEAEGPDEEHVGPAVAADLPESVAALVAAAEGRRLTT